MEHNFELREECNPIDPLVLAAYHEAGHAVIAALQRFLYGVNFRQYVPFRYVTIRPRKERNHPGKLVGAVRFRKLKYYSDRCIIVALAGPCAEACLNPTAYSCDSQADDYYKAGKIMEYLGLEVSAQNIVPYWDQCKGEVNRAWPAIEDLAKELLRKYTLTQKEVFAIIEKHGIKYNYLQFEVR
jgi:hypothetical protein